MFTYDVDDPNVNLYLIDVKSKSGKINLSKIHKKKDIADTLRKFETLDVSFI